MYKDVGKVKRNKVTGLYDSLTDVGIPAIRNSIKNILLTPVGSLPGNPRFGSQIFRIIFEPMDSLTKIVLENFVREQLRAHEPRVKVIEVEILEIPEFNRVNIDIKFQYLDKRTGTVLTDNAEVTVNRI